MKNIHSLCVVLWGKNLTLSDKVERAGYTVILFIGA